ncbi:MAG: cell division protein FtsL [Candidatus Marinimicrobia bacterium]|nr:cell division protein FtsL [Candidatus Neomarinimicrobiota bacterium]|tara:strand:- start:1111 stop:1398 length:288 start_codon:yes stop_codon:yes gene_type:complete
MKDLKNYIVLALLFTISFTSSLALVLQTYEFRNSFSVLDKLKIQREELYFKSNILIEEVEYYKNHISLREVALNGLGMKVPISKETIVVIKGKGS